MATAGFLAILALVTHHLARAVELQHCAYLLQLPRGGIGRVFMEVITACCCLELVQLAAESHV